MIRFPIRALPALVLALLAAAPTARGQAVYTWGFNGNGELGDGTFANRNTPTAIAGFDFGIDGASGGGNHSLLIRNGVAYGWGYNGNGELGTGNFASSNIPVHVGGLSFGVTAISAGSFHSLAIRNGHALAWGYNAYGQVGIGTNINQKDPLDVNGLSSGVTAVSAGYLHSLAIQNGAAVAWGYNGQNQLGDGTATDHYAPVAVTGLGSGVTAVSAGGGPGGSHSLAIVNGAVYGWGFNGNGQLGNGNALGQSTPVAAVGGLDSGVTAISAGLYHSLAIKDGVAYSFGTNGSGQLGDGNSGTNRSTPFYVLGLPTTGIMQVSAGDSHSVALTTDHRLFAWGRNVEGQFGNGTNTSSLVPVEITAPSGYYFASINAGANHTTATLMSNATGVYATGVNFWGQLGNSTYSSTTNPVPLSGMNGGVNAFAIGGNVTLVIRNGVVYGVGANSTGQMGVGNTNLASYSSPILVHAGNGNTAVATNGSTCYAIRNGVLLAWGFNGTGQLGSGIITNYSSTPGSISFFSDGGVTAVSVGGSHTLAIQDGQVYGWGSSTYGQVGNGSSKQQLRPVPVQVGTGNGGVTTIATGANHSLAIKNGAAYGWGFNQNSQLGNGDTTNQLTPVPVFGMASGVTAIVAGTNHSMAIKDGVVYAWGYNGNGELGDGTTTQRFTAVPVIGLPNTGALQIALGENHSLALMTDHRLFAWGDNSLGQFGNGTSTTNNTLVPVEVFAPAGFYFASIDASSQNSGYVLAPVPEPATILSVGALALGAVGAWRKRRSA